jgi:hypothetical protein
MGMTLFAILTGALSTLTADAIKKMVQKLANENQSLNDAYSKLDSKISQQEAEQLYSQLKDAIQVAAGNGEISIDEGDLQALNQISFDHENGNVNMKNTTLNSSRIETGGSSQSTGETIIHGDTTMSTKGTSIKMSGGAKIVITGNAKITQS